MSSIETTHHEKTASTDFDSTPIQIKSIKPTREQRHFYDYVNDMDIFINKSEMKTKDFAK